MLREEITTHAADIEKDSTEKDSAAAIRKKEAEDYSVELADYTASIDALIQAIKAMKANSEKADLSLAQLSEVRHLKNLPLEAADSIDAYLSDSKVMRQDAGSLLEQGAKSDTQASREMTFRAFQEFQSEGTSGTIVGTMEGLLDKFKDQRMKLQKEEAKKKNSFSLLSQSLESHITQATKEKEEKTQLRAKREQDRVADQGELDESTSERDTDQKYYHDLKATCDKKAADFDTRQKTRSEEIQAITKAIEIISSQSVSGAAETHLPSLLQTKKSSGAALAFLRANTSNPVQSQVAKFLQQRANSLNSRVLSAAAARITEDSIDQVRNLIQSLIDKMKDQLASEATKKAWCDEELASNKATREEKSDAVDSLQADVDEMNSAIATLGEEVATFSKEITELNAAVAAATEIRQKEKQTNKATIKDAKEAEEAVAEAMGVLKEFYAKAGEATAFVQTSASKVSQPEVFGDEPYAGMGAESGGVVGLLEVIKSDFARLQAETSSEEVVAQQEYNDFMQESKLDKASKQKAVEHKTSKRQTKERELQVLESDLQGTHKELDAALAYFEKLKADCMDSAKSFSERKAQRDQELKDLQTALDMLNQVR
eukprot:TRINITY_DN80238_c0_g1_i2.p1 TRINITY_DN80238_c0_g1~~TRINITY_DN80238_c0_g1_i2.p1  ORF type:complete len:708 (+),score=227.99 TRINITY_DN80238_c0_g1_i2:321-2126(+)